MEDINECREFRKDLQKSPAAGSPEDAEGQEIWVGVRIRPPSDKERQARELQVWDMSEDERELRLTVAAGPVAHASPQM